MDEQNNYGVIGLTHLFEMRDELTLLRYENELLRTEIDTLRVTNKEIAEKHLEIQQRIQEQDNDENEAA